jgi:molecular chaperone GrpE
MLKNMKRSPKFRRPSEELQGKVMDEVVKGYYLNDKLIRFAKVVVGK